AEREFEITRDERGVVQPYRTKVTASERRVFVEAVEKGPLSVTATRAQYEIVGLKGKDADNTYGLSEKITLDKQDYQGIRAAYEFDPVAEKYVPVDPMDKARWYPTLVGLDDGRILAVSGLDDVGMIDPGDNEIYDPKTKKWSPGPKRY
ncbi:kelch repeat-containing protein, partial [Streptomyces sp. TRM76130]|nr:kelch repeat-containing protein [Streptomyces sp. TRM76130]